MSLQPPGPSTEAAPAIISTIEKRAKRSGFTKNEKNMIVNAYKYVTKSWPSDEYPYKRSLYDKTACILGIGVASVHRTLKEHQATDKSESTAILPRRPIFCDKIEEYNKGAIRRKVYELYAKGILPTQKKVFEAVNADDKLPDFNRTMFQKLMRHLKFQHIKKQRKIALIDRDEIVLQRRHYLRLIKRYRRDSRPIFYVSESYVETETPLSNSSEVSTPFEEQASMDTTPSTQEGTTEPTPSTQTSTEGPSTAAKLPPSKRKHLVVMHVGNEHGFVEGACEIYEGKTCGTFRDMIDNARFEAWFEKILPLLGENAIVVLDSAKYHWRRAEKIPKSDWKKINIQQWLRSKGLSYLESEVKAELLKKVKIARALYKTYSVEEIARRYNVTVLKVPRFHSDLNPVAVIWCHLKDCLVGGVEYDDLKKRLEDGIRDMPIEKWQAALTYVQDWEDNFYMDVDLVIDKAIDTFENGLIESSEESSVSSAEDAEELNSSSTEDVNN